MSFYHKYLFILGIFALSATTQSAILITNTAGEITGINGILINDVMWNAKFHNLATNAHIYDTDFAYDASEALLDLFLDTGIFSNQLIDREHSSSIVGFEDLPNSGFIYNYFSSITEITENNVWLGTSLFNAINNNKNDGDRVGGRSASIALDLPHQTFIEWTYVPIPQTIWMLLSGIGCLFGLNSSRKRGLS